jgi:nucleoside-diphosphate-sugar epimerase
MRVLLTGHRGFIGAVMAPLLRGAGHEVVGLDTGYYDGCDFGDPPIDIPDMRRDLRDTTAADVRGFDAIIHLAALSNDPLSDLDPELTYEINHHATVRLAELARTAGVSRFLFSSSCSNYGSAGDGLLDEQAAFNPVTPYGVSKVRAERDLLALATEDFSPVLLRSATAYGLSPRLRGDIVLNNLTAWAVATGRVLLKSDGTPWRPVVHVEDICHAFLAALEAPRAAVHAQAFNVGRTGENYRIRDLAEAVRDAVPGCVIEYAAGAAVDARNYRVDCSKIAATLPAFRPRWTVRDGARSLSQAFRDAQIALDDFEGARFRRVGRISQLLQDGRLGPDLRWRA